MRISVECGSFTEAADACRTANQITALAVEALSDRLLGTGGMAGNDTTSGEFARAYDTSAAAALDALSDLTHAFIGAGRLLAATGDNHAAAETASAGTRVAAYVGGSLDEDSFVRISPTSPPSSLGAQEPSLGRVDAWILDQIEGFVWPGADVDRLRTASAAWRRCAASVARLDEHVDVAVVLLERQRSPEIPLAVAALEKLSTVIADTAWQVDLVAKACEEYAAAVEDTHDRTRALLKELAQMAIEGVALSAVIAGISGGLGGGAAAAAAVARIKAYAPRFHALLVGLRATTATAAARLRSAHDELVALRARVEKFLKIPVRDERGSFMLPGGGRPVFEASPKHSFRTVGRGSPGPRHGQEVLEDSVPINASTTSRRVGYDSTTGDFVVFDEHEHGAFHGHVRDWAGLTHQMQRALIDAGVVSRKGRPILKE